MNLIELVQQITYYFEDSTDLTDTVVIRAINSARKAAETQYAFELNKKVLQASVDLRTGAPWTSLAAMGTTTPLYDVRSIKRAYLASDDNLGMTEIMFAYRDFLTFNDQDPNWGIMPMTPSSIASNQKIYLVGDTVYFYPFGTQGSSRNVFFDAYVWMNDYPYEGPPMVNDWMLKHGHEYLFWKTVWDLNYKKKEFVPRQEGNLQVSLDNAAAALQRLIFWDSRLKAGMTSLNELL
jgi:hypothetical protein